MVEKKMENEFCWAVCWDSDFIQKLCREGFLPIASPIRGPGGKVLLPKLHTARCVMDDLSQLRVSKSARKHARKISFSVDTAFKQVLDKCVEQHGINWIGLLASEFEHMFQHPGHGVVMHSIEAWNSDGELVAGEIGWSCGSTYTRCVCVCVCVGRECMCWEGVCWE